MRIESVAGVRRRLRRRRRRRRIRKERWRWRTELEVRAKKTIKDYIGIVLYLRICTSWYATIKRRRLRSSETMPFLSY
ncbi:hypothetical protein M5689_012275 [Euphorbia peplus]|nr:hypothetical protein M5689_012275 [Euphorbia peplus]